MALEAQDIMVRVALRGGSAFEAEAAKVAGSVEGIGAAAKKAQEEQATSAGRLGTAGAAVAGFGNKMDKAGRSISGFGRAMAPLSALSGFGLYEASKSATAFNKQMTLLVTQAYLAKRALPGLSSEVEKLSTKFGVSPTANAMGAYPITSDITRNPHKIAAILAWADKMAVIGGDTVNNTANALTSIMATHLGKQYTPGKIAGEIESAIGQGKMRMPELTQSFASGIMPLVKAFGGRFPMVLASIAALAREGVPPTQAANRMRLTLSSVASPTVAGTGAMARMGLNQFALANSLRSGGLLGMLEQIQLHTSGMSINQRNQDISEIFGKSRGASMIESLLNQVPQISDIFNKVQSAGPGLVNYHAGIAEQTPFQKQEKIKAQFQVALIQLGQEVNKTLLPLLLNLAHDATKLVDGFSKLPSWLKKAIVDFGALVTVMAPAALVLGGTLTAIGKLAKGFGILLRWTGILATADKVASGENGVGGLSSAIKDGSLIVNLTRLGTVLGGLGLGVGAYELYKHHNAIENAGHDAATWLGTKALNAFGIQVPSSPSGLSPSQARHDMVKAEQAPSLNGLLFAGQTPLYKLFAKEMGISLAEYQGLHPNRKEYELHNHLYIDGKQVQTAVHKQDRKRNNRR